MEVIRQLFRVDGIVSGYADVEEKIESAVFSEKSYITHPNALRSVGFWKRHI
jgi:hypothetical protein